MNISSFSLCTQAQVRYLYRAGEVWLSRDAGDTWELFLLMPER
jgi:hypothetical protein